MAYCTLATSTFSIQGFDAGKESGNMFPTHAVMIVS